MPNTKYLIPIAVACVLAPLRVLATGVVDYSNLANPYPASENRGWAPNANNVGADDVLRTTTYPIAAVEIKVVNYYNLLQGQRIPCPVTLVIYDDRRALIGSYDAGSIPPTTPGSPFLIHYDLPVPLPATQRVWVGLQFGLDNCGFDNCYGYPSGTPTVGYSDNGVAAWSYDGDTKLDITTWWTPANYGIATYAAVSDKRRIGEVKSLADGWVVNLTGKAITLSPRDGGVRNTDYYYIEEPDRSAGIRLVAPGFDLHPNDLVKVLDGVMAATPAGERYIDTLIVDQLPGSQTVRPLGQSTKAVHEDSLCVGLLIRTAGRVVEQGADYFIIADGYYKDGGEVHTKVLVVGDVSGDAVSGVSVGKHVTVTGAVSAEVTGSANVRVILLRELKIKL